MPNLTKPGANPTPGGAVTSDNTLDDASPVRGATVQLTEAHAPQHLRGVQAAQQADGLRWAIRIRFAAANVVGGMLVWVYLRFLFPWNDAGRPRDDALNERVFLAYLIVVTLIAFLIQNVLMNLAVRWAERGRLPGRFRRGLVLRLALTLSVQNYLWWALAGLIFAWLNHSPRVGIGIAVVGLVTSTSIYLLLDRPIRPLIDLAQAGQVLGRRQRDVERRIWLFWLLGSGLPLLAVGLALLTSPTGRAMPHWRLAALLGAGLGAGGAVMWGAASSTGRRIERVRRAMGEVGEGNFDVRVPLDDGGDLGRLAAGFNSMTEGLEERAVLHDLFGRHVGRDVARWAMDHQHDLGGEERQLSVLFVDLDGFTAYSEAHAPREVVKMLNRFFGAIADVVTAHGGWINKFEGDAALCIFGAPVPQADHGARALGAAAELPSALAKLPGSPRAGVGVATGTALAGYVGTPDRHEYTVIGDVVNIAARLCEGAKHSESGVLADAGSIAAADGGTNPASRRALDSGCYALRETVQLRGRTQETEVYELLLGGSDGTPGC